MKGLIIIILVLLVLGLYFVPAITKGIIHATGHATVEAGKKAVETIKDNEEVKQASEDIKQEIITKFKEAYQNE